MFFLSYIEENRTAILLLQNFPTEAVCNFVYKGYFGSIEIGLPQVKNNFCELNHRTGKSAH